MNIHWARGLFVICCVTCFTSASASTSIEQQHRHAKTFEIEHSINAASTPGRPWRFPVDQPFQILRLFDLPNGQYRPGHRGVDIATREYGSIRAPTNATVSFAGVVVDRPVLSLAINENMTISFEPVSTHLTEGDAVKTGQMIGELDHTRHCRSPCVHVGIRVNGEYQNPVRFFVTQPTLLPIGKEFDQGDR